MDSAIDHDRRQQIEEIASAFKTIIKTIGEDCNREGLLQTPERFACAMLDLTRGYRMCPKVAINEAKFDVHSSDIAPACESSPDYADIVVVRDIDIASLCEHHCLPFVGKAHIGYLPKNTVLGISKLARIADIYARRLQIQERLTRQVAHTIHNELEPHGVIVMIQCVHMCMSMRGTRQANATTMTLCTTGAFQNNRHIVEQFHSLLKS